MGKIPAIPAGIRMSCKCYLLMFEDEKQFRNCLDLQELVPDETIPAVPAGITTFFVAFGVTRRREPIVELPGIAGTGSG